jgi:hypothetical protein
MAAQQRFRITVAVVVACSLLPLAYSVFHQSAHRQAQPAAPGPVRSVHAGSGRLGAGLVLQGVPAPYLLPVPVRYPAVAAAGGLIWVFGGRADVPAAG